MRKAELDKVRIALKESGNLTFGARHITAVGMPTALPACVSDYLSPDLALPVAAESKQVAMAHEEVRRHKSAEAAAEAAVRLLEERWQADAADSSLEQCSVAQLKELRCVALYVCGITQWRDYGMANRLWLTHCSAVSCVMCNV